jgi:anaerobic selenocysteine-containing dehydrogenase
VSAILFRGGQGHGNSYHVCFAVNLLSALVGAVEVPGGTTGWPARTLGYPGREDVDPGALKWSVYKGLDGFLQTERFGPRSGCFNKDRPYFGMWPIPKPVMEHRADLKDVQPIGSNYITGGSDREEIWEKLGVDYNVKMMFISKNPVMSVANRDSIVNALRQIDFIIAIELFNTETTEGFADIVLPDTCFLEKNSWATGLAQNFNHAWGMDDWCYHIAQAVVEPQAERRHSYDIEYEIVERLAKEWSRDLITEPNERFLKTLPLDKEYWPETTGRLTVAEIGDGVVKSIFGPEHDWEWFKKHGFIRWPKRVVEAYWMWFLDLRIPVVYMEWLVHMREELDKINEKTGLGIDLDAYTPLISWYPSTIHKVEDPKYDLYCYSYRDILHSASQTMEQPWLDEASLMNPYTYHITMNADTAKEKGIKDGDAVEVETYQGRKVTGAVKLLRGHHPLALGIAACSGHFAKGLPIASGKGSNFNTLLPIDFEHIDPITGNI